MTAARWILYGSIKVLSPMAIRTGAEEDRWPDHNHQAEPNPNPKPILASEQAVPIAAIELDHQLQPFIPATAIKGLLRGMAADLGDVALTGALIRLLGDLPREDPADPTAKVATGGVAEFHNAHAKTLVPVGTHRPAIRGRTALHEGSRTAEAGQLRHDRIVAPDTLFSVTILLDRAQEADVQLLLALLGLINGESAASALGAGAAQGDGRVQWVPGAARVFGSAEALVWMGKPVGTDWTDCAITTNILPLQIANPQTRRIRLPFTLQIAGHFLVSTEEIIPGHTDKTKRRKRPYRVDGADDTTARLAGSSLDGALRAQARRIYRTISGDFAPWPADDTDLPAAFEALFGSTRCGSLLETETFVCKDMNQTQQEFVAIDRFSGGSDHGAKFDLRAFEAPALRGAIALVMHRAPLAEVSGKPAGTASVSASAAAIGLLALTLKDLACGDISLGFATRKGYGGVGGLEFDGGTGWQTLLESLGTHVAAVTAFVPGLQALDGLDSRKVIEAAVTALQVEAKAWVARHTAERSASTGPQSETVTP